MLNPITALPGIAGALVFKNWMKSLAATVALSLVIHLLMSGDPFEDWGMLAFGAMNLAVTLIWWAIVRWIASRWRRRRTTEPPAVPSS